MMSERKKPHTRIVKSKKSEASKKGWNTRRKNQNAPLSKNSSKSRPSRSFPADKLKNLQKTEKVRNISRLKAQKKGRSLATDKPKLNLKKPTRPARRASKKRVSIR